MFWANERDMNHHLLGTVVRHDGKLIRIVSVSDNGRFKVKGRYADGEVSEWVHIEDIDISMIPSGYVQRSEDSVLFISRIPNRRWKQGLDDNNLQIKKSHGGSPSFYVIDNLEAIQKMVDRDYPSVEDAAKSGKWTAFNRNMCLSPANNLYFQGTLVGSWKEDLGTVFSGKYSYLKKLMEVK